MKTRRIFMFILFVLTSNISMAQFLGLDKPIPPMFISLGITQQRQTEFESEPQRKSLRTNPLSIVYPVKEFVSMLDKIIHSDMNYSGMRVYIGATKETKSFDSCITLIYVPTINNGQLDYQDLGHYYIWDGKTFVDHQNINDAQDLVDNYTKSTIKTTLGQIKYRRPDLPGNPKKVLDGGDTKSILYRDTCSISQLKDEFDVYQSPIIKAIGIEFSSYGATETLHPEFHNRLLFHYKMMRDDLSSKGQFIPYSIEDNRLVYEIRSKNENKCVETAKFLDESGFDTGAPCPPTNCNAAGGESLK
jgi:hypothetical protein